MTLKWKTRLAGALASFAMLAFSPAADACRDCVFPMAIGENRWLMPSGEVEVQIEEAAIDYYSVFVSVVLRDAASGRVLASGCAIRKERRQFLYLHLVDRDGRKVNARIQWVDRKNRIIKTRFTCENTCTVKLD